MFEPIAIVGRSAVLPGVHGPAALWDAVVGGKDLISSAPEGRWRLSAAAAMGTGPDRTWSDRGGYVRGFEKTFAHELARDPFVMPAEKLAGLDPLFQLVLHTGRAALREAGGGAGPRVGAIFGNLSYPSETLSKYAESVWFGGDRPDPLNRFMSGMPAHLLASVLGLQGPCFALDAACASSLYALKLAADALHDRRADLMLAGAVNRCDDLFIHTGFCALKAMSQTGQSRPFHADADGLVPAEGAGFLALKRLEDAQRNGDTIHAVIRGIGLSNDGRGKGFLAPAVEGQVRAMRGAWHQAELDPNTVSLLECHATGTVVGDATELDSMAQVFGGSRTPIGSLKSNLGHLITAAGVAGILKVTEAMAHGTRPPTLHTDRPTRALNGSPFRVLGAAEAWTCNGPRRAGVNAFGFGGNNAHVILEEPGAIPTPRSAQPARGAIAIVALGARVAGGQNALELMDDLANRRSRVATNAAKAETIPMALEGLRFPPKDLQQSRAQQLLVLAAAREAVDTAPVLSRERTMVLVGMGCDAEVCRYGARWRLGDRLQGSALETARDAIIPALGAAGVVGNMPNIPANRMNSQFDLGGPSFTVSAEELSGGIALDLAMRALNAGEVDAAVVGASDLSVEPVHTEALAGLGAPRTPGDAAVVFVLERLADAKTAGHPVLAILDASTDGPRVGHEGLDLTPQFGHAHAASGLVHLAAAVLSRQPATVVTRSLTGFEHRVGVKPGSHPLPPRPQRTGPVLEFAAHPPSIVSSPAPTAAPVREVSVQTMTPAPSLPPTTTTAAPQAMPSVAAALHTAPAPAVRTLPSKGLPPKAPPTGGPAAALIAAQQALGAVHQQYMAQQQALHDQFLHTRMSALDVLARARHGRPLPTRVPVAPAAAPVQSVISAPAQPVAPPAPAPSTATVPTKAALPTTSGLRSLPDDGSRVLPGPRFSREDLEHLASHAISERFGPMFSIQDDFPRQVRMPEPPLLLADRVTGMDAEPGSMKTGTIWTETDITSDAWYLHQGHIPPGVLIETGQADLLLCSYLGADFENKGERVYRLLGCELTYRGGLPKVGDTLKHDIHIDAHAKQGDQRLFFFHSDTRVDGEIRLSVREGQAGFFSDEELANSGGILWTPETGEHAADARVDAPEIRCERTAFSTDQVRAFAQGDAYACFGPGFEETQCHTRTPRIQDGNMTFLHEVTEFDAKGGPWGRGYLKATQPLAPDDWFLDGHFKDDPCMPGTLMLDGCIQALSFYMAALGFTVKRDGWRFEPVPDVPYALKCRGQCTPNSRLLTYEVFVEEVIDGPIPTVWADFLCVVDGLGAFHARRVGVQLVPGWPLDEGHPLIDGRVEPKPVATMEDGFPFDYKSLLACAWGKPSEAFGAPYTVFDHVKKVARLPGPPYHFLSRVTHTSAPFGGFKPGVKITVEYDVPEDAWYFWENVHPTMPFAVLLEAALQPCGWLASYVGSALSTDEELFFRNLDGTGTQLVEVLPTSGTLRTEVEITAVSASGGMIIEGFTVHCFIGDVAVYDMTTVFGFFPGVALANQLGIPPNDDERAAVQASTEVINLRERPSKYFDDTLSLPNPMLLMCDRITGWWPEGGKEGLGRICGEKDVNPSEWFFKSHFFQDPVQPGSLGIENLVQVLQWAAIEKGLHQGMKNPHFEPLMLDRPMTWKYRGQVIPKNKVIRTELDIVEEGEDERGRYLVADGWLWADDLRIYQAIQLGVRVVDGPPAHEVAAPTLKTDADLGRSYRPDFGSSTRTFDPTAEAWLSDHRPTWTVPALPAMSMVDRLIGGTGRRAPVRLEDVAVQRWLPIPSRTETRVIEDGETAIFEAWRTAENEALSRFEPVCTARFATVTPPPAPWEALVDAPVIDDPYVAGTLFHGPSFQYLIEIRRNGKGASAIGDVRRGSVPAGATHQGILDAMAHAIPHDSLAIWWPELSDDQVAYPYRMSRLQIFGPPPAGTFRVEVRPHPLGDTPRFPSMEFQILSGNRLWAEGQLTEVCLPKGLLGNADPEERRRFLEQRKPVEGMGLSTFEGPTATATEAAIRECDWLPGTVDTLYGIETADRVSEIAVKDAVAAAAGIHPGAVQANGALRNAPLTRWPVTVDTSPGNATATVTGGPTLDIGPVKDFWSQWFNRGRWPVEDLYYGLIERFIGSVHLADPDGFDAIKGRSVLYLANHQVAVESLLFSILASGLAGVPTVTLAKMEHQHTWLGRLIAHSFTYPEVADPGVITFFDREDKASLPRIIGELAAEMMGPGKSVMVHIEGTRALECRTPVQKMSSAFIDMAVKTGSPIVPVRFTNALPTTPLETRLEFPLGMGRQDIWFGSPIHPETFANIPYKERKQHVIRAINDLGPSNQDEQPTLPDLEFQEAVEAWQAKHPHVDADHAVLAAVLAHGETPSDEVQALLDGTPQNAWGQELYKRLTGATE